MKSPVILLVAALAVQAIPISQQAQRPTIAINRRGFFDSIGDFFGGGGGGGGFLDKVGGLFGGGSSSNSDLGKIGSVIGSVLDKDKSTGDKIGDIAGAIFGGDSTAGKIGGAVGAVLDKDADAGTKIGDVVGAVIGGGKGDKIGDVVGDVLGAGSTGDKIGKVAGTIFGEGSTGDKIGDVVGAILNKDGTAGAKIGDAIGSALGDKGGVGGKIGGIVGGIVGGGAAAGAGAAQAGTTVAAPVVVDKGNPGVIAAAATSPVAPSPTQTNPSPPATKAATNPSPPATEAPPAEAEQAPPANNSQTCSPNAPSLNTATVNLIKSFEGFEPSPAPDPINLPTVGFGHKCQRNACSEVPFSFPLNEETGAQLLQNDAQKFTTCLNTMIGKNVQLNDNQFGALTAFAFNVGCGAVQKSTLLKRLNAGEDPNTVAAKELPKFNKAGGRKLKGLTRRRNAEVALFQTPSGVVAHPVC